MKSILDQPFDIKVDTCKINVNTRDWLYILTNSIYPLWSNFAKTDPSPIHKEEEKYAKRKDIGQAFDVIIMKFGTLERLLRG